MDFIHPQCLGLSLVLSWLNRRRVNHLENLIGSAMHLYVCISLLIWQFCAIFLLSRVANINMITYMSFILSAIRAEVQEIEDGVADKTNNVLKWCVSSQHVLHFENIILQWQHNVLWLLNYHVGLVRYLCNNFLIFICHSAPHCLSEVTGDTWDHPYSRTKAAMPLPYLQERKFWPSTGRIDDVYGDRHLVCRQQPALQTSSD